MNRKAEAIAAAKEVLDAFPTVEQVLERLKVSQTWLARAAGDYALAKTEYGIAAFDLAEAEGEKKLLQEKGVLADAELAAWTVYYDDDVAAGTKLWVTWPCGDPKNYAPLLTYWDPGYKPDCPPFGHPQGPLSMGAAGAALAYALGPAWEKHGGTGVINESVDRSLVFPGTVTSVDTEAGTGTIQMIETRSSANQDLVVQDPVTLVGVTMNQPSAHAWRAGDIAAVQRTRNKITGAVSYDLLGWFARPKYIYGGWSLYCTDFGATHYKRVYYPQYASGRHPAGQSPAVLLHVLMGWGTQHAETDLCADDDPWHIAQGNQTACDSHPCIVTVNDGIIDWQDEYSYVWFLQLHGGQLYFVVIKKQGGSVGVIRSVPINAPDPGWIGFVAKTDPAYIYEPPWGNSSAYRAFFSDPQYAAVGLLGWRNANFYYPSAVPPTDRDGNPWDEDGLANAGVLGPGSPKTPWVAHGDRGGQRYPPDITGSVAQGLYQAMVAAAASGDMEAAASQLQLAGVQAENGKVSAADYSTMSGYYRNVINPQI